MQPYRVLKGTAATMASANGQTRQVLRLNDRKTAANIRQGKGKRMGNGRRQYQPVKAVNISSRHAHRLLLAAAN